MSRVFVVAATLATLTLASCSTPVTEHVIVYEREVAFEFVDWTDTTSGASILNAGPGSVEQFLVLEEDGEEHATGTVPEGALKHLAPANFRTVKFRRSYAGTGRIVLTVDDALRSKVRIDKD